MPKTDEERFLDKIIPEPNSGCWIWLGGLGGGDYGAFRVNGKNTTAHRFSYQLYKGEIPEPMVLDHLCRVRCCVNPDHLEPVSQKENINRGEHSITQSRRAIARTHCKQGHPYSPENTFTQTNGYRGCRLCLSASQKSWIKRNMDRNRKYQREYARRTRGKGGKLRIECDSI